MVIDADLPIISYGEDGVARPGRLGDEGRPRIIVGGDVCPTARNFSAFQGGDPHEIFGVLSPILCAPNLSVVNLESPFIENESGIQKVGPTLGAPTSCAPAIRQSGIRAVGLANNHILDHGRAGLISTLKACRGEGVEPFGADLSLDASRAPVIFDFEGERIGFYGVADREFSVVSDGKYGANPLDLTRNVRDVKALVDRVDHAIVLVHGGVPHVALPPPRFRRTCRLFAELGARLVVAQHSHVVGPVERVADGWVVFGQGNLVFDWVPEPGGTWEEGTLVSLILEEEGSRLDLIPFRQVMPPPGIRGLTTDEFDCLMDRFAEWREILEDKSRLDEFWDRKVEDLQRNLLLQLLGRGLWSRRLVARLGLERWLLPGWRRRVLLNLVRCEAHREVLELALDEDPN